MRGIVVLEEVELMPVLELAPVAFAKQTRPSPSRSLQEAPEEWHRYWSDSLADSGLTGLMPVRRGWWHVPTAELNDAVRLRMLLEVLVGGRCEFQAPSDADDVLPLDGGLALRGQPQNVLIEPSCCADLGNIADWREAVRSRETAWQMLWIGHPWVSVMFQQPWLIISDRHESESPVAHCAVCPDKLEQAVVAAEVELERFAKRLAPVLSRMGYAGDSELMGWKLAGLQRTELEL
jgi:hypothetical protein